MAGEEVAEPIGVVWAVLLFDAVGGGGGVRISSNISAHTAILGSTIKSIKPKNKVFNCINSLGLRRLK